MPRRSCNQFDSTGWFESRCRCTQTQRISFQPEKSHSMNSTSQVVKAFQDQINFIKSSPSLLKEVRLSDKEFQFELKREKLKNTKRPFIHPEVERNLETTSDKTILDEMAKAGGKPVGNTIMDALSGKKNAEHLFNTLKLLISTMKRESPETTPVGWLSSKIVGLFSSPETGNSSERSIRRHLQQLVELGLIVKVAEFIPNTKCARYSPSEDLLNVLEGDEKWVGLCYVAPGDYKFWHTTVAPIEAIEAQEAFEAHKVEAAKREAAEKKFQESLMKMDREALAAEGLIETQVTEITSDSESAQSSGQEDIRYNNIIISNVFPDTSSDTAVESESSEVVVSGSARTVLNRVWSIETTVTCPVMKFGVVLSQQRRYRQQSYRFEAAG